MNKILVVDDDADVRNTLSDVLQLVNYEVDVAVDGQEALDKLRETLYQFVILDIKMPNVDGVQFLQQYRDISPYSRIIVLTAHGSLESAVEAVKGKAEDYLMKPVKNIELIRLIREMTHMY